MSKVGNNNTFWRKYYPLPPSPLCLCIPSVRPRGAAPSPPSPLSHNILMWFTIGTFHSIFISTWVTAGRKGEEWEILETPRYTCQAFICANCYNICPFIMEKLILVETIAVMFIPRYLNWSEKSLFISYTKYTMTITLRQQET